uniref:Uncharacterized protein n=1 Tax=Anguilla anguilla TaxID=7936 RepID=A0A0E9QJV5_ANGAN
MWKKLWEKLMERQNLSVFRAMSYPRPS